MHGRKVFTTYKISLFLFSHIQGTSSFQTLSPLLKKIQQNQKYLGITNPQISIEILAWNCRGLNNDRAFQGLQTLIWQKKSSLIFLTETKIHDRGFMNNMRLQIGYRNCEVIFSEGQSGHGFILGGWVRCSSSVKIEILW